MTDHVLDSSAVLADLFGEPGAESVRPAVEGAFLSAVNYAEVISKLVDNGVEPLEARERVDELPCSVVPPDPACAAQAGTLRAATRRAGLTLGDRFCLALALQLGLPVLTADRRWKDLDIGVDVRLIR